VRYYQRIVDCNLRLITEPHQKHFPRAQLTVWLICVWCGSLVNLHLVCIPLQAGKYRLAARYYQRIVDYLKSEESLKDDEADKRKTLLLAAHLNLAMCRLKLSEDLDALQSCDEALALDPKNEKGLFRRGMVCIDQCAS